MTTMLAVLTDRSIDNPVTEFLMARRANRVGLFV
jgi:hypothetical protein